MSNHKAREMREAVASALREIGISSMDFGYRANGHQEVIFPCGSADRHYIFPSTSSDRRALLNSIKGVQRKAREWTR